MARFTEVTSNIQYGAFDADPQPFMGAVVSARAASKLVAAQAQLIEAGATPILEMKQRAAHLGLVSPAILDVTNARDVPDEEHFGPMVQVTRYKTLRRSDRARERYGLRPLGGPARRRRSRLDALPAHDPRRHRQLEPADQWRIVGGAVRRHRTLGQPAAERVLRGGLLLVSDGVGRKRAVADAGERIARPQILRDPRRIHDASIRSELRRARRPDAQLRGAVVRQRRVAQQREVGGESEGRGEAGLAQDEAARGPRFSSGRAAAARTAVAETAARTRLHRQRRRA